MIGLSSALALIRHGAKVTIIERGSTGNESSWAGGGILSPLCPWDYPDEVTRLTLRGAALFPAWAQALHSETGIDPEYETSGMLVLPPFDVQSALQWCAAHNVLVQQVEDSDSLPLMQEEALLLPQVAQVRNPRLMHALRAQVEMLGGKIIEQCEVRHLVSSGNQIQGIATTARTYCAENYIVTSGAWSKQILGELALQLDIKPMQGQMLLFKFEQPPFRHILLQNNLYLIPRRDGHLLVGSTLEDVGFDKQTTQVVQDNLRLQAEVIVPQLYGMPLVQHWAGLRPASPHNIPTIGRHPGMKNLYVNSGHFRYGVTMATVSAEILFNEIMGNFQPFDVAPYQVV